MYVDIGMDLAVRASQVLGVFDLDNTSWSKRTREFLQRAQEDGCLIEATDELPKFNASILARRFAGGRQQ